MGRASTERKAGQNRVVENRKKNLKKRTMDDRKESGPSIRRRPISSEPRRKKARIYPHARRVGNFIVDFEGGGEGKVIGVIPHDDHGEEIKFETFDSAFIQSVREHAAKRTTVRWGEIIKPKQK